MTKKLWKPAVLPFNKNICHYSGYIFQWNTGIGLSESALQFLQVADILRRSIWSIRSFKLNVVVVVTYVRRCVHAGLHTVSLHCQFISYFIIKSIHSFDSINHSFIHLIQQEFIFVYANCQRLAPLGGKNSQW